MTESETGPGRFDRLFEAFSQGWSEGDHVGLSPGDHLGPYRIERLLGQGGMGAVLLARRIDGQFEQDVAIKVLRWDVMGEEPRRHFLVERQILAQVDHPNIARVFDGGVTEDGRPYLVMEYVEGERIDRFCDERRLSIDERLRLFLHVCEAVQYAHQNLIVHRDLKPGNVIVSNDGRPKLLDFGVAKLLRENGDAGVTRTAWNPMTPDYASPEQVRGDPITTAVDIYALGVLLYELLSGALPHRLGKLTPVQIMRQLDDVDPVAPSAAARGAGPVVADDPPDALEARARNRNTTPHALERRLIGDLDVIVLKAMHRDPRRRYASAAGIAADIRRHIDGLPVSARPDTVRYRASRMVRRHPAATGLAVTVVLSLAGFLTITARHSSQVTRERDRAERVTELLSDILAGADPTVVPGEELTVRGALDRAVEQMRQRPEDPDPVVDARLLDVIAAAYDNLDAHERAVELSSEAVDLLRGAVSPDHPTLLNSLIRMSGALMHAGRRDEAVEVLAGVLDVARDLGGDRRGELAAVLNAYGLALHARGEAPAAEPFYVEALAIYDAMGSAPDSAVEAVTANLGWAAHARADWVTAESRFRDVLGMRVERLSLNHPQTALTRLDLADVLNRRGKVEQAHAMADSALTTIRAAYPAGHSQLANALRVNSSLLSNLGRLDEAASTLEEALEIYRGNEAAYGSGIRYATNGLARIRERQGRLDEAVELYTTSAEGFSRELGESHPFTAVLRTNIAWAEHLRGENDRAEAIFRGALPVLDSAWAGTPSIALTLVNFSTVLAASGKCGEAEPLLRRAVGLELEAFDEDHDRVVRARRLLGGCLLDLGRPDEAEAALLSAYESLMRTRGASDAFTAAAALDLVRLYEVWGKEERAREYRSATADPPS